MIRLPCRAMRKRSSRGRPRASRIARCHQGGATRAHNGWVAHHERRCERPYRAPEWGRQDVAWGVSPRNSDPTTFLRPASPGGATETLGIREFLSPLRGSQDGRDGLGRDPGAHAPGYVLTPLWDDPESLGLCATRPLRALAAGTRRPPLPATCRPRRRPDAPPRTTDPPARCRSRSPATAFDLPAVMQQLDEPVEVSGAAAGPYPGPRRHVADRGDLQRLVHFPDPHRLAAESRAGLHRAPRRPRSASR